MFSGSRQKKKTLTLMYAIKAHLKINTGTELHPSLLDIRF